MLIDWCKINSDGCFESLIHAILFVEYPDVVLFRRSGRDAGQDARSGDGKTVYQAKFRQNPETIISLAKNEFNKIEEGKSPGHPNYELWKNVTQWVLISNADVNSNDVNKWNNEIKPKFTEIGIEATYWNREELEQKIIAQPQIANVFFGGANRCFIGLREMSDVLRTERLGGSYDTAIIGRDSEIETILDYADQANTPFYRIIGSGGVGKTRLLYEVALKLSDKGFRVLWGLPESMASSDKWFESLNDNRKTIAVLDDITDASLVERVVEQARAIERKNWKFIFAYRPENERVIFRKRLCRCFSDRPLEIKPLERDKTNELTTQKFENCQIVFLDLIYRYSAGNPGWIWLLLDYFKRHDRSLQPSVDEIAADYVDSAFQGFEEVERESAKILLQWLALWRITEFAPDDPYGIRQFLKNNGVSANITDLLAKLIKTGLVFQFGYENRRYKVQPMIMREAVLSNWLFVKSGEGNDLKYSVSDAGKEIVSKIISGDIIFSDKILRSLTQLSLSRLNSNERFSFVHPIFDTFNTALNESDITANVVKRIVELTSQIGNADLESAIGILYKVLSLKNIATYEGNHGLWGHFSITYKDCLADVPWFLFCFADHIHGNNAEIAKKYLKLFQCLCSIEESDENFFLSGKRPSELLRRIFRNPDTNYLVKQNAIQVIKNFLKNKKNNEQISRLFVEPILGDLLSIEKEKTELVNFQLHSERCSIQVGSEEWNMIMELRKKVFFYLETHFDKTYLWEILADSHFSYFRRLNKSDKQDYYIDICSREVQQADAQYAYRQYENQTDIKYELVNDLKLTKKILESRQPLSAAERHAARRMWGWHYDYGKNEELKTLANECEIIKSGSGNWQFDNLFFFPTHRQEQLDNVVKKLKESQSVEIFHRFFDEMCNYIDSLKSKDLMFGMTVGEIAKNLAGEFNPAVSNPNPVSQFALEIIDSKEQKTDTRQEMEFTFAVVLLRYWIKTAKESGAFSVDSFCKLFTEQKNICKYFSAVYSSADFVAPLTEEELNKIFELNGFIENQFVWLLGTFADVRWDKITSKIESLLGQNNTDWNIKNELLSTFIEAVNNSARWEQRICPSDRIAWFIKMVASYQISGKILETYRSLYRLGEKVNYKFSLDEILSFAESRIELAKSGQRDDFFGADDILEWFVPIVVENDDQHFHKLCGLTVKYRHDAYFFSDVLPDIIFRKLNPSGDSIKNFVKIYELTENKEEQKRDIRGIARLVSRYYYQDDYLEFVGTILTRCTNWSRDDRIDLYYCLVPSSTSVLMTAHGEVNQYYFKEVERAKNMRQLVSNDSLLIRYLDWNICRTEENLNREQEWAEEARNDTL